MARILVSIAALFLTCNAAFGATSQPTKPSITREQFEKAAMRYGMVLVRENKSTTENKEVQFWRRGGVTIEITLAGNTVTNVRALVAE